MSSFEEVVNANFDRTEIDNLTVLQATSLLSEYCLIKPDESNESIAARMIVNGLYVAVGLTKDERAGVPVDDERWVYRLRVATNRIPFRATKGIEVRLPYGSDVDSVVDDLDDEARMKSKSGVYVSFGGEQRVHWHPTELLKPFESRPYNYWRESIDISKNTVGQVDESLIQETTWRKKEHIGFLLKDVIWLLYLDSIDTFSDQLRNVTDLQSPDN